MNRIHLLAAETYKYSYANFHDPLGIGNVRFGRLMPETAATLEKATEEGWPPEKMIR